MGQEREPSAKGKPRLIITVMYLANFKSYAGVQRVGPFDKCFSSVVGPNGSGKSNVIDALLFVFGYRAKKLRLNKVSELIHNSTNHQDLDQAKVSVHFQEIIDIDDVAFEYVPGTELVISRTAHRDNTSKYFINDRVSSFKEVHTLLMGKGIDLENNRFLILQGEVEQIAMMKPKGQNKDDDGLLEYLEDIIGSNRYVERIEEFSKRLEELNEERVGKVQRVKLVEKEKNGLEGAKNEAQAYIKKETELLQWKAVLCQSSLELAKKQLAEVEKTQQDLEAKLEAERAKRTDDEKKCKELEKEDHKYRKEFEGVQAEMEKCAASFKEFERKDVKAREDIKHKKQKIEKLDQRIKKDKSKLKENEKESADAVEAIPRLEQQIVDDTERLEVDERELERLQKLVKVEMDGYRTQLQAVHKELEPWDKQLNEAKDGASVTKAERKLLAEKHEAARKAYEDADKQQGDLERALKEKSKELKSLSTTLEQLREEVAARRQEEKASQEEEEAMSTRLQSVRARLAELQAAKQAASNQSQTVAALLKEKSSGRIPGIVGQLGDLGAIDAKYDVAISTACGALDYILVDTTRTAQACVEFLRQTNSGTATFLIQEQQGHLERVMHQVKETPEGVPRLFDLIKVQDKTLLPSFYFALRDTVVAKDLEQGNRIAFGSDQRFRRVVTLNGVMYEGSGTMSGGGNSKVSGKMGSAIHSSGASSDKELAQVTAEADKLSAELDAIRSRAAGATAAAEKAEKALAKLEVQSPKCKLEVESVEAQLKDLTARLGALLAAADPSKEELARIAQLDADIIQADDLLAKLNKSSAHLRKKAEELQHKMEIAGGEPLVLQKARVAKLQKDMDSASTEINRLKVLISSNQKAVSRFEKSVSEAEKEREKVQGELETSTAELKELEKEAFVVSEDFQRIQDILDGKRKEVEAIQAEYLKCKALVDSLRAGEVDIQFQLEDCLKGAEQHKSEASQWEKKLADIRKQQDKYMSQLDLAEEDVAALLASFAKEADEGQQRPEDAKEQVARLEGELKDMKPNMAAIGEYRRKEKDYSERAHDLQVITEERDAMRKQHDDLRKQRLDEFMEGFNTISLKLKEMYQMITLGGDAELELVDSLDPFSEGIVFSVRPPKKSWKNISNLSGGEKTLSSLALVFALHHYRPTPLYVMDEIDAALDFKNVSIVAHYIKDRTKNAQFIIISLRNNMFELADRLVGIYKTDNATKSITINPSSFAVAAVK